MGFSHETLKGNTWGPVIIVSKMVFVYTKVRRMRLFTGVRNTYGVWKAFHIFFQLTLVKSRVFGT